ITRRLKDHIGALLVLRIGQLTTFSGIVPGGVRDPYIIVQYPDAWIDVTRALFITNLEPAYQRNVHSPNKTDYVCLAGGGRDHSDQERSFMLFEQQARDVRRIGHSVNQHEMKFRIISGDIDYDRPLRESHAGNQVIAILSEGS